MRVLDALLVELGAVRHQNFSEGGFDQIDYSLPQAVVRLDADYGAWRASIAEPGRNFAPASFWLAALHQAATFPDPAVVDRDLVHLREEFQSVLSALPALGPVVDLMRTQYRRAIREKH